MTSPITMPQEKPRTIDAGRKKELKAAAKKAGFRKTANPEKRREQDIADLRQMLGDASTFEEALEINEKLNEGLISEEKFQELTKRFRTDETSEVHQPAEVVEEKAVPPAETEETPHQETVVPEEQTAEERPDTEPAIETAPANKPETTQNEPVATREEEAAASDPLRRAIGSEIVRLEEKLRFLEDLSGQKSITEAIELAILESKEFANDPDLKEIYNASDQKEEAERSRNKTELQIKTLTGIDEKIWKSIINPNDPDFEPVHELETAYASGEISDAEWVRIIEEKNSLEPHAETAPEEQPAAEDLSSGEIPDLLGFMEKTIREQAQARARQRMTRKRQKATASADETELAARARMRRMAKMRLEGASKEEIGAFETTEARFEPTPEMIAISEEINRVRKTAEQQLAEARAYENLDETALPALENLRFTLWHLGSLQTNLRQAEVAAREEFEERKESAKKLLGMGGIDSTQLQRLIHIEGWLPEENFDDKLRRSLQRPAETFEKRFLEKLEGLYASGDISEEAFLTLRKSVNPSDDLDLTFASGGLGSKEYRALREAVSSPVAKQRRHALRKALKKLEESFAKGAIGENEFAQKKSALESDI